MLVYCVPSYSPHGYEFVTPRHVADMHTSPFQMPGCLFIHKPAGICVCPRSNCCLQAMSLVSWLFMGHPDSVEWNGDKLDILVGFHFLIMTQERPPVNK